MNSSKHYLLAMFPYPSGEGLHVGHVAIYTGTDVLARYWRRQGKEVLAPMGWDAFGLPAENFAIKKGVPPAETTDKNILNFRKQMDSLDLSYDWQYEINTSKPEYYKWTQWVFLQLFKQGVAYQSDAAVNWCESCQTVLANEQVVEGKCERCGNEVIQKKMRQWFLKITDYAEELLTEVEKLDWPEKIKQAQRNWIGKSTGSRLHFKVKDVDATIEVFTTRADTLFGCSYVVLAPEHPLVAQITTAEQKEAVAAYVKQAAGKSELERTHLDKTKSGVFTGAMAINPINQEPVPIWVADYVVMGYGTGAIMAVPAHDERDLAFAQKYDLAIKQVIAPHFISDGVDEPRADKETVRRQTVIVLVKHWADDKYYTLDWKENKWHSFVIGGIEDGETAVEAAKREVKEETGYQNIKNVYQIGPITHAHFYAHHKGVNRYSEYTYVVAELGGPEFTEPDPEEVKNHLGQWLEREQITPFINLPNNQLLWDIYNGGDRATTDYGILINSGEYSNLTSEEAAPKITEAAGGKLETMWRLRDWLVSRQRYWGAPIPIIHCEKCGAVPVPEEQLPVKLPEDVDFKPTGHSPLADSASFNDGVVCPKCGAPAKREVDTMDTFVCSSWYFLRYPSATVADAPFDPDLTKKWLPVDEYVGGAEHAVLHLLYSRFVTKALRDAGHLDFGEPFLKLRTIGLILGPDHQKMSKSRGNVVNPDDVVADYGSDALRLHELFLGPFADEKPWNTETIKGVVRFLETVNKLTALAETATGAESAADQARLAKLHRTIQKVTDDLAEYRFNTAIAALMSLSHEFGSEWTDATKEQWLTFIELLSPLAPKTAHACWQQLGQTDEIDQRPWPKADSNLLVEDTATFTVMVNGKLRGTFTAEAKLAQAEAIEQAKQIAASHLDGNTVAREVFVPGKLVNFVLTD